MSAYKANPALEGIGALVGEWEFLSPAFAEARGRVFFEWLEGGAFLLQRSGVSASAPDSTWIYGSDDSSDSLTVLYYDSRGVSRVYRSTLRERTWRIWREAPGFSQRFTGHLASAGDAIDGSWDRAADGVTWQHDFDLTYRRLR